MSSARDKFDEVARIQRAIRDEAAGYNFFIAKGFVTDAEELFNLYKWFNRNGCVKDNNGRIRVKILKKLKIEKAKKVILSTPDKYQPSFLKNYIKNLFENN